MSFTPTDRAMRPARAQSDAPSDKASTGIDKPKRCSTARRSSTAIRLSMPSSAKGRCTSMEACDVFMIRATSSDSSALSLAWATSGVLFSSSSRRSTSAAGSAAPPCSSSNRLDRSSGRLVASVPHRTSASPTTGSPGREHRAARQAPRPPWRTGRPGAGTAAWPRRPRAPGSRASPIGPHCTARPGRPSRCRRCTTASAAALAAT